MANATNSTAVELPRASRDTGTRPVASGERRERAASIASILFDRPEDRTGEDAPPPAYFIDLNCDQIVDAITAGRDEYNLKPFFYRSLSRVAALEYRHEIMQDLENPALYGSIGTFAGKMREVRGYFDQVQKAHYREQKQAWFLDAVACYCRLIETFAAELAAVETASRGFRRLRDYLAGYAGSAGFASLRAETKRLKTELAGIEYCVLVRGSSFTVRKYDAEVDDSVEVEDTFDKFKQGAAKDYKVKFPAGEDMNHVEAKILEFVAKLHPAAFTALHEYCVRNGDFIDDVVAVFDREVQFYIAYLEYIAPLRQAGLQFCYPRLAEERSDLFDYGGFDLALAHKLVGEGSRVVPNDFELRGEERVLVVSGPNQGGKTTFARMFGQLQHLACIGCPVPGERAQLAVFDRLYIHFEKQEKVENLRGKLEDDLVRIREILDQATANSVIIMNEIFTSTTVHDETFLSRKVMEKILDLDAVCVWVTFVDELASFGPQTVSMVSTVVPDDPAQRTFKVLRRPADGLAYAMAIARKYRLTYASIKERIKP